MVKKVLLKDIAEKVGVSIALVSYVLNNKKEGRIGKEIAEKIKATAKKMNYRPNLVAKSLKSSKTNTIGLIVSDIANPFSANLARIIEDEAEMRGYIVIFGSSDEKAEKSGKLIDVFLDRQVDGFIIAPAADSQKQIETLLKNGVPVVLVDRYFPELEVNYVGVDNYKAAFDGVQHMLKTGCQRIGIVTFNTTLLHLKDRKRGYKAALKKSGIAVLKDWIQEVPIESTTQEDVEKAVKRLLQPPASVDGILFASNKVSTYALKYLNTRSTKIPKDLSIVSFDQSDAAEVFYAPLTHIYQPLQQIGDQALALLLQNLEEPKKVEQIKLEAHLILGKSTRNDV